MNAVCNHPHLSFRLLYCSPLQASNRYKVQLEGLEDQLLQRLADAPADILADVSLIEVECTMMTHNTSLLILFVGLFCVPTPLFQPALE